MPKPTDHAKIPDAVPPLPLFEFDYDDLDGRDRIGTGGDADVYQAIIEHGGYTYPVAVKEPRFEGTIQSRIVEKFEDEARTWSNLTNHDNIVSVYAWGTEPLPWMGLEYMDGGTLAGHIGSLNLSQGLWLAGRIAEGVRYGHRHGVAHLDIKPTNVLLRDTGSDTWDYPKVSDWGLAKMLLEHSNSIEGVSPTYAAPEQFDSETFGNPDDFTDIYQLGTVVYAMLAGEPPFTGPSTAVMRSVLDDEPDPPSAVNPTLPDAVDEPISKALSKQKGDRYESLVMFRKELDRLFKRSIAGELVTDNSSVGGTARDLGTESTQSTEPSSEVLTQPDNSAPREQETASTASPTQFEGTSDSGDGPPLISRRSALGLAGMGVLGAGGIVAMTQTNNSGDIGSGNGGSTGGDGGDDGTESTGDGSAGGNTGDDDGTGPSDDSGDEEQPDELIVFDDFEDSEFGWSVTDGQESTVTFSSDSIRGSQSLYFRDGAEDTNIKKTFNSHIRLTQFNFWFKYNSNTDNNFSVNIQNASGDRLIQIREFHKTVHYKNDDVGAVSSEPVANISQNAWYKMSLFNIDYDSNTLDVAVIDASENMVDSVRGVEFRNASEAASGIIIINSLQIVEGPGGRTDPLWIDHITYRAS